MWKFVPAAESNVGRVHGALDDALGREAFRVLNLSRSCPGRRLFSRFWLLLVCLLLFSSLSPAEAAQGPKIGLVLGGGGARGMAHLGVIRWLEENRIPVHYLVGTSMGGLIGGLYAMGHSPEEIESLVENIDWDRLFSSSAPFSVQSFRRKQDTANYPVKFEIGWRHGATIPTGLNASHFINLLLQSLTLPYWETRCFDQLPIPFRCVATDLEDGDPVTLSQGSLWRALRATMAIPGVFVPVEYGGQLLIDGGVLNNLPADVAKSMGADVVIAVDVGSPLKNRRELQSILGIIDQTINVMILDNVRRSLRYADIVLVPELDGFQTLDFRETTSIIERGYEIASAKEVILGKLALEPTDWKNYVDLRSSRRKMALPHVDRIEFSGLIDPVEIDRLSNGLAKHSRRIVRPEELQSDLTNIYGEGRFYSVGFQVSQRNQDRLLEVLMDEKSYGPPFTRFGLEIDGAELDNIGFGLRARTTFFDLGRRNSETRVDLGVGRPYVIGVEYLLPITGRWFIAPKGFGRRNSIFLYEGEDRVAEYLQSAIGGGIDLGYGFGSSSHEVRTGISVSDFTGRVRIGDPVLPRLEGPVRTGDISWIYNSLDDAIIPRRGIRVENRFEHVFDAPGASENFNRFSLEASIFGPIGMRNTVFGLFRGGTSFDFDTPFSHDFTLGGPLRLGAYSPDQLRGSRLAFASAGLLHQVLDSSLFLGGRGYLGAWYEVGSVWDRRADSDFRHVSSAGFVLDSVVGPVFLGGSWGESNKVKVYFSIGALF